MSKKRFTEEQIVAALRQAEAGMKVTDVCRKMGVSEQSFYRCNSKYAGLGVSELREMRRLRDENRKLKHLVADRFANGSRFRVLTVVDLFTRECLALFADRSISGKKVSVALDAVIAHRGAPKSITVDNGTEFVSRAMESWSVSHSVRLDFIRPGRPVENAFVESFNGRLRDECLHVEIFDSLGVAREQIERWRLDSNTQRPHSALADRTPEEFARAAAGDRNNGTRPAGGVRKRSAEPRQGFPNGGPCGSVLDPSRPISGETERRAMPLAVSPAVREELNLVELGPSGPRKSTRRAISALESSP